MTILDIVSRDAFKESPLESGPGGPGGPGWPGGRWEPALNQSTKTSKRGWSLGGVARAGAMGGLVVGGAAAAVLARNAQSRKELTDQIRAAIVRFLDIDNTGALQSEIATIRGTISTLSEGADARIAADEERRASESDTQQKVGDRIANLERDGDVLQQIQEQVSALHKSTSESDAYTEELVRFVGAALEEVREAQIGFERIRDQITRAVDASVNTSDTKWDGIRTQVEELVHRNAMMKAEVVNAVLAATDASDESTTAKLAGALEEIRRLHAEMIAIRQGASLTSKSTPNVMTPRTAPTGKKSTTSGRGSGFGGRRYV